MGSFNLKLLLYSLLSSSIAGNAEPVPQGRPSSRNAAAAQILEIWAKTVRSDPSHYLASWTGQDPCDKSKPWKGVRCETNPETGYEAVASLEINGAKLGPNIHLQGLLDQLVDLGIFHANNNGFVGGVPDLVKSKYLYEVDLSTNQLSGYFPTGVLSAPLIFLDIRFNHFQGNLPGNIFNQQNLQTLFVNNNQFSGNLPDCQPNNKLTLLSLANNAFTGSIPRSWGNMRVVQEIQLLNNRLTGTVPEELCAVRTLKYLDVTQNPGLSRNLGPNCQALKAKGVLKI